MSEHQGVTEGEGQGQGEAQTEGSSLRQRLEDALSENRQLKAEKRDRAITEAGIPDAAKPLIEKAYDGEWDADSLRKFATDHGISIGDAESEAPTPGDPNADPNEQAFRGAQERVGQLGGQGESLDGGAPSLNEQEAEAIRNQDWAKHDATVAQKLAKAKART